MGMNRPILLVIAAAVSIATTTSSCTRDVDNSKCPPGKVCVFTSQDSEYLSLGIINMSADPIRLPALHGVGGPATPAMFFVRQVAQKIDEHSPPSDIRIGGDWDELVLFPNESIAYALPWGDAKKLYDLKTGCGEVVANFVLNEWQSNSTYFTGEIHPSRAVICVP